jgi:hypothetical protein
LFPSFPKPKLVFIETKQNADSSTTDSKIPLIFISENPLYLQAKAVEFCLEWAHLLPFTNISMIQTSCVSQVQEVLTRTLKDNKAVRLQDILSDKSRFSEQKEKQSQATASASLSTGSKTVESAIEDIARIEGTENNYAVTPSLFCFFFLFCCSSFRFEFIPKLVFMILPLI